MMLRSRSLIPSQISRSLAKLLGGDAWIDPSTRLGSGSTFWFSCIVRQGGPIQSRKPFNAPPGLRRVTLYAPPVIIQATLLNELRGWGFSAETVPNINAIKSKMEEEGVDILIIDPLYASADDRVTLENMTRYVARTPLRHEHAFMKLH
jgi:hypothetical protein